MPDRDDPLEELRRLLEASPPALQRVARAALAALRPPPADAPADAPADPPPDPPRTLH